jgi:hypothetical protein
MSLQKFYRQVFIDEERTILVHYFHRSADIYVFLSFVRKLSIYAPNESPIPPTKIDKTLARPDLLIDVDVEETLSRSWSVSFKHHRRIVLCIKQD